MSSLSSINSGTVASSGRNYCGRVQRVICVIGLMSLSAYFAGCDISYLGRCKNTSKTLDNCAFSVVIYAFSNSVLETGFQAVSWKMSSSAALTIAVLFFFNVPLSAVKYIVELERYLALFWLLVQGLIIIDIAHEVHLFIINRAEFANSFGGVQAARRWYVLHICVSCTLFLIIAGTSYSLHSLCGRCTENIIAIEITLSAGVISLLFSLSEYCNKGCLIPAIVCCYSILLCASAVLTNPNWTCNTDTDESRNLRDSGRIAVSWLLLVTSIVCMVYASLTGSSSVITLYKCIRSYVLRPILSQRESCLTSDTHSLPLAINDHRLEQGLFPHRNPPSHSNHRRNLEKYAGGVLTVGERTDEENSIIAPRRQSPNSVIHNDKDLMQVRTSSSGGGGAGGGGEGAGENTSLLRDHQSGTPDSDFSACSSKSADDLNNDSALLFHIQLGLSACYLAVHLSDWTGIEESTADESRIVYLALEAMYLKLTGDYIVCVLYAAVLLNSYIIYRHYNRRLRDLIRV